MSNTEFYIRRLHSISGIVPIGLFLLEHTATISTALVGPQMFNAGVEHLASIPTAVMIPLEIFAIAIPFLFHIIYGLMYAFDAQHNVGRYTYARNRQFWLQRMTAFITVAFLIWHVGYMRFFMKYSPGINFNTMHDYLSNPLVMVLYIIGFVAAIYHFTNGLFTFCITWGIAVGPKAQDFVNKLAWGLFALMSVAGVAAVVKFAAGA